MLTRDAHLTCNAVCICVSQHKECVIRVGLRHAHRRGVRACVTAVLSGGSPQRVSPANHRRRVAHSVRGLYQVQM